MQKLTKAQEAWLIEQLKEIPLHVIQYNRKSDGIFDHNLECWVADTVKKIINQCTEKEFPGFEIDVCNPQRLYQRHLTVELDTVDAGGIILRCESTYAVPITFSQFKQFTEGCMAICRWLDEQDE